MATKKQKRLALAAKREEREEVLRQEGLAAQAADRARRDQVLMDDKIRKSRELVRENERKRQKSTTRNAGQILTTYALIGAMMDDDSSPTNNQDNV